MARRSPSPALRNRSCGFDAAGVEKLHAADDESRCPPRFFPTASCKKDREKLIAGIVDWFRNRRLSCKGRRRRRRSKLSAAQQSDTRASPNH
jgi:hypothetical protein